MLNHFFFEKGEFSLVNEIRGNPTPRGDYKKTLQLKRKKNKQ